MPVVGGLYGAVRDGKYEPVEVLEVYVSRHKAKIKYLDTNEHRTMCFVNLCTYKGSVKARIIAKYKPQLKKQKPKTTSTLIAQTAEVMHIPQLGHAEVETFPFVLGEEENAIAPVPAPAPALDYINPTARYINVVPTRFSPDTILGDFGRMMTMKEYVKTGVLVFNDNYEQFKYQDDGMGGGNACARPGQKHGLSIGIPTGTLADGGFKSLSQSHYVAYSKNWTIGRDEVISNWTSKEMIDLGIARIVKFFIDNPEKDTLYYSANQHDETDDRIGMGIFKIGDEVREYITKNLAATSDMVCKAVACNLETTDDIYYEVVSGLKFEVPTDWTGLITRKRFNEMTTEFSGAGGAGAVTMLLEAAYSNFPNSFAVHIETVKETPAHGGGPATFINSVYSAIDLGDTKCMQLMCEIQSIAIRRRHHEDFWIPEASNPCNATEVPAEWEQFVTLEQYKSLIVTFGSSPFPRSLLDIGYLHYPQSLLNIMMMQGDSASRESFMKNSFSSSEFEHKAFVANRIVHLRKQTEA